VLRIVNRNVEEIFIILELDNQNNNFIYNYLNWSLTMMINNLKYLTKLFNIEKCINQFDKINTFIKNEIVNA